MLQNPTATRNIIRRTTFQEATEGNSRTINGIQEELQDVLPVSDSVRNDCLGKMNSIMDEATTKLTDTAVKFWARRSWTSEEVPETQTADQEADNALDASLDATLNQEIYEGTTKESGAMWLDIITDERMPAMKRKKKPLDGVGLEYVSARQLSAHRAQGEGQYAALGGAYIRFIPQSLTHRQRKELDVLTDSWDGFLSVYNSLTLKYKGLLQEHGKVKIPGAARIVGKSDSGDEIWDDFMDTKKVRNPTLRYIMRNLKMFRKYYDKTAKKTLGADFKGPAAYSLADTVTNTALKRVTKGTYSENIADVIMSVPKRIFWTVMKSSQDLAFQAVVPTFLVDRDTRKFRVRMNVLDATFSLDAALKTGICWGEFRGGFEYSVRLRKYAVNTGVLNFVFGINEAWIEQGRNFLEETMQDGTNAEVETEDVPW